MPKYYHTLKTFVFSFSAFFWVICSNKVIFCFACCVFVLLDESQQVTALWTWLHSKSCPQNKYRCHFIRRNQQLERFRRHVDYILITNRDVVCQESHCATANPFTSKSTQHFLCKRVSFVHVNWANFVSQASKQLLNPGALLRLSRLHAASRQPCHLTLPHLNCMFIAPWN